MKARPFYCEKFKPLIWRLSVISDDPHFSVKKEKRGQIYF